MVGCAVFGCTSRTSAKSAQQKALEEQDGQITFHVFPRDEEHCLKWVNSLHRQDFVLSKNSRLCSLHFDPSCFYKTQRGTQILKDANPTIFPDYENNLGELLQFVMKAGPSKGRFSMPSLTPKIDLKYQENYQQKKTNRLKRPRVSPQRAKRTARKTLKAREKNVKAPKSKKTTFPRRLIEAKVEVDEAPKPAPAPPKPTPNKRKMTKPRRAINSPASPVRKQPRVAKPRSPRRSGSASGRTRRSPARSPRRTENVRKSVTFASPDRPPSPLPSPLPPTLPSTLPSTFKSPQSPPKPVHVTAHESNIAQDDYDEIIRGLKAAESVSVEEQMFLNEIEVGNEEEETVPIPGADSLDMDVHEDCDDTVAMDTNENDDDDDDDDDDKDNNVDITLDDNDDNIDVKVTEHSYENGIDETVELEAATPSDCYLLPNTDLISTAPRRSWESRQLFLSRKRRLRKLQSKKRSNVLRIAALRVKLDRLNNQNVAIEERVTRMFEDIMMRKCQQSMSMS